MKIISELIEIDFVGFRNCTKVCDIHFSSSSRLYFVFVYEKTKQREVRGARPQKNIGLG